MGEASPHRAGTTQLRDGTRVVLRPIEPDDKDALAAGHERLSPESRYRRYLSPMPQLSPAMLRYLTEVDHHDHEAIVAVDPGSDEVIAVARFVRSKEDPETAEAAVTVADDRQGQGLGRELLDALADRAKEEGVRHFTALVLADNPASIRLLESLGASEISRQGEYVELNIELPDRPGIGPQLAQLLQEAAVGSLVAAGGLLHRAAQAARSSPEPRPASPARRWQTIVAGTDGSEGATEAVRRAAQLAKLKGCRLHLVSAYGLPPSLDLSKQAKAVPEALSHLGWVIASPGDAEAALGTAAALARDEGLEPVPHTRRGDPADVLIEVAEEEDADLIVVGSLGMSGPGRFLLGGVPNKVSHHAPCGVLLVR
jgi:nucleotide-binding universal stress UspA family protein